MDLPNTHQEAPVFTETDFEVFTVPGLEPRMEALIAHVRPKLTTLGDMLAADLTAALGEVMYAHVAKHARRSVHPPSDTWVAWSTNNRGYKMLPHFQVGLFSTHVFVQFAIIYESGHKNIFAEALRTQLDAVKKTVPPEYGWSMDHTKPDFTVHKNMTDEHFAQMADKLSSVKKSEVTVGLRIGRDDPLLQDGEKLYDTFLHTFNTLVPLYRMSF